jgi:hypothetical protein
VELFLPDCVLADLLWFGVGIRPLGVGMALLMIGKSVPRTAPLTGMLEVFKGQAVCRSNWVDRRHISYLPVLLSCVRLSMHRCDGTISTDWLLAFNVQGMAITETRGSTYLCET